MNDFSNIGFANPDKWDVGEFKKIIEIAADKGEWIETPNGFYVKLSDNSGAEIWAQTTKDKALIGGHPGFKGETLIKCFYKPYFSKRYSALDGSIYSQINVPKEEIDYPIFFDCLNFFVKTDYKEGENISAQITAFAKQDCKVFENYFEYKNEGGNTLAEEAFIPAGTFNLDGNEKEPTAHAVFSGTIKKTTDLTNSITGKKFYHLVVKTLSMEIDVVISHDVLNKAPKAGRFIVGVFWLSGKIINL